MSPANIIERVEWVLPEGYQHTIAALQKISHIIFLQSAYFFAGYIYTVDAFPFMTKCLKMLSFERCAFMLVLLLLIVLVIALAETISSN